MDYAQRINRLAGRLHIMGMAFALVAAIIFLMRRDPELDFTALLAAALIAAGLTAGLTGDYLLRLIRKHPDVDQQTF